MIYTIGGLKGNTGKTTIATNLAIWLSKKSNSVALISTGGTGSPSAFIEMRKKTLEGIIGFIFIKLNDRTLNDSLLAIKSKYSDIVIDNDTDDEISTRIALLHSDIILLPFLPWAFSMTTINALSKVISEIKNNDKYEFRAYCFINMANIPGASCAAVRDALLSVEGITFLDCNLSSHNTFPEAARKGLSIFEMPNPEQKVIVELHNLFSMITSNSEAELPKHYSVNDQKSTKVMNAKPEIQNENLKLKQINVSLTEQEVNEIRKLREAMPNPSRSAKKRLPMSLHDFIVVAVQEKIERDKKQLTKNEE